MPQNKKDGGVTTRGTLKKYLEIDPDFEKAIAEVVDAEVIHGHLDPAEGTLVKKDE